MHGNHPSLLWQCEKEESHLEFLDCVLDLQYRAIMQRKIPDTLKLAIAKRIENNLFSKVAEPIEYFHREIIKSICDCSQCSKK
jgi:hypothetical protein